MKTLIIIILLTISEFTLQNEPNLTVNQILSAPEKYNNKIVTLESYYVSEFENSSLWESKKESKKNNLNKSIWINGVNENTILLDRQCNIVKFTYLQNKYIRITGTIKSKTETIGNFTIGYGHMNIWHAEIQNITKIEEI